MSDFAQVWHFVAKFERINGQTFIVKPFKITIDITKVGNGIKMQISFIFSLLYAITLADNRK